MKRLTLLYTLLFSTLVFAVTENRGFFDNLTTNDPAKTTIDLEKNVDMQSTGGVYLPKGTSIERPAPTKDGMLRFNSTLGKAEIYIGSTWTAVGGGLSAWVTATAYIVDDIVVESNKIYKCLVAHTSGTFATDLAALDWVELSNDVSSATGTLSITNGGTGNTTGTATINANLTGPITSVGNATSIASQTGTGTQIVVADSPTLITPILGTPTSATLTNATGLPIVGGTTGTLSETRGGTNQTTYTTGDILHASGTNTLVKLAIGSTSQYLTVSGGIPAWTSVTPGTAGVAITPGYTGSVGIFSVSYGTTDATTVCSASPCSYLDQIGTDVSSITRSSTGVYTMNLARTYTKLKCSAVGGRVSGIPVVFTNMTCSSCSTMAVQSLTVDAAPITAADSNGTVTCIGSY